MMNTEILNDCQYCSLELDGKSESKITQLYVWANALNDTDMKMEEDTNRSQKYQQDYLKSVVTECMHDFTTEVRKQLWHIEWDMTKNFQRLKEENERQQEGFNRIYENMMLENQRLREENAELKKSRQFYQL